jgi:hypothetical protein
MEKNKVTNSEDIHIKVDQNNLIYIDPNSVIDGDGNISARNISAEKLVMYVNLEADLVSRSILASSNDTNTLTSVASGTLNFMKNGDGQDYDTTWTDSFLNTTEKKDTNGSPTGEFFQSDKTGQSFGINDINISIKGFNSIPTISINFIDVRGKTLFESPENSPYKAFFHIPWPIFYLTVKGFYGKAIKYRLHLVKFTSKFNESNGNFEVNTSFVGSTYAYLSDIPLQGILNAPYLFPHESIKVKNTDTKTGKETQTLKKSSRGYEMLNTVYNEYKLKGLIDNDFPVKTLREVLTISKTLDTLLEKQIFGQVVDMRLFAAVKELGENIDRFEKQVVAWKKQYLENTPITVLNVPSTTDSSSVLQTYYVSANQTSPEKLIKGNENGSLEFIITNFMDTVKKSILLTEGLQKTQPPLLNKTNSSFTRGQLNINEVDKNINVHYIEPKDTPDKKRYAVRIDKLISDIREIRKNFEEEREKLEKEIQEKMNEIISNKNNGFGFKPTIRNIFAVILSNAEVLIRLMKDVHKRAFDQGEVRKLVVGNFSKESDGESIYPWPELKATVKNKENTIIYPGDPSYQNYFGSDDPIRWPEVAFIETYIGVSTNKSDPLTEKETGIENESLKTQNNIDEKKIKKISSANAIVNIIPYVNKLPDNFLYEIQERASTFTLIDTFSTKTLQELANIEFSNISNSLEGERALRKLLKDKVGVFVSNTGLFNTSLNISFLKNELEKLSPFEKYSYYRDSLPTTNYLVFLNEQSFNIEQYKPSNSYSNNGLYSGLTKELSDLNPEEYRTNIYPFSSDTYLSYLKLDKFDKSLLKFNNYLEVDTSQGFISGQIDPKFWIKSQYETNIFSRKFNVDKTSTNILNTPYFHKQLYTDFNTTTSYGKYVGSAYLLLNSLPFTELDEKIADFTNDDKKYYNVLTSSIFREVGSSQYVPYHVMLKWGSIYHRYKKYINEGIDILTGFTTSNTNTTPTPIDGAEFFDFDSNKAYTIEQQLYAQYNEKIDLGIHPYYDDIFYNVVNNISYFNFSTGTTTGFTESIDKGILKLKNSPISSIGETLYYWTQFVNDESLSGTKTFTLLPSAGGNNNIGKKVSKPNELINSSNSFDVEEQNHFRIVWDSDPINNSFFDNSYKFSSPNEYETSIDREYGINSNYKKVMDLIATFEPSILDEFEKYFLMFASENVNLNVSNKPFEDVVYSNFQQLLKEIVTIDKDQNDVENIDNQINNLQNKQKTKLEVLSSNILSYNNLIKITLGNPKKLDPHVLVGFVGKDENNTFTYNNYSVTSFNNNKKYLNLYLGPEPVTDSYKNFFIDNNVEVTEENVLIFRPLVYIYAGFKKLNLTTPFKDYLEQNILTPATVRYNTFMNELLPQFSKFKIEEEQSKIDFFDGYNNKALKVELYNFFKSMNDKWIAGNSIGQRSLLEEFLFIDKANKDIGNEYYFDLTRLTMLEDEKNLKMSLFSAISTLLSGTGFDLRALPAYVNFYGTNFSNTPKIIPSKKIAQNLFGTFLDVDTQESSPKILIQFVGKNSTRPDMSDKKNGKYKFTDDSFNVGNVNNNPVMITLPKVFQTGDLAKTNKVVAFEVSFGDQNQSIFKGVQLDQASIKNTSESFVVLENLARSESGSSAYNVDIGLFDYYRQAAYTCDVTCMGNVMIQPTMYFYLKNIPMFKGTYWITEVSHSIKNGSITTTFKGSRMPYSALPDLTDSFMSSYRTLFDKIQKRAVERINGSDKVTETSRTVTNPDGAIYTYDTGSTPLPTGWKHIEEAGITKAGIPYNGFSGSRYISQVKDNNGKTWLRSQVVEMGSEKYQLNEDSRMKIVMDSKAKETTPLIFKNVKTFTDKYKFYATKFIFDKVKIDDMINMETSFYNPSNGKEVLGLATVFDLERAPSNTTPVKFSGAIDIMKDTEPFGIAMSEKLMLDLKLKQGDIVYFNVG